MRRQVVRHEADDTRKHWEEAANWGPNEKARFEQPEISMPFGLESPKDPRILSGLTYTTCEVFRHAKPQLPRCNQLNEHAVIGAEADDSLFQGIARLSLAERDPARQRELFAWVTPAVTDPPPAHAAFEEAKAAYWTRICSSSLLHLELLKDTADFKACDLIRLLYLAGETPADLRRPAVPWRHPDRLNRNENFSQGVEARIERELLEFKHWIDDPFFVARGEPILAGLWGPELPRFAGDGEHIQARREAGKTAIPVEYEGDVDAEMTYWSENHQLLFASCEYLAGQWMPNEMFCAGKRYRTVPAEGTRPGDLTGEQRMTHAKPRLLRWLDDRLRLGFAEWNAPGYYAEDIRPLLNLVDFCLDEAIRRRAEMVLDLIVFDLARFTLNGNFGAAAGRCYFSHKACGYDQSVGDVVEVMFGTRGVIIWDAEETAGAFASSPRYIVPDVLVRIGQDRPARVVDRSRVSLNFDEANIYGVGFQTVDDAMFWWARGAFFAGRVAKFSQAIVTQHHLGETPPFDKLSAVREAADVSRTPIGNLFLNATAAMLMAEGSSLTRANLYTYKNSSAMLSSAQNWRAGQLNAQGSICEATLGLGASVFTTHLSAGGRLETAPGSFLLAGPALVLAGEAFGFSKVEVIPAHNPDGPNWWTGTVTLPRVVQRDGSAIIAYNPDGDVASMFDSPTHAWFPKAAFGDSVVQRSANCNVDDAGWTFGKVDDGYVALFSARPASWASDGPWADKDLIAEEGRNIFVLQVGDAAEFESYEKFVEKVAGARIHINGLRWKAADFQCSYDMPSPGGGRLELHYDDDEVRYNGMPFSDDNFPRFETPYVKCGRVEWAQYHYTIALGVDTLTHDFRELKTKVDGATVQRYVGGAPHDCEDERFWVIANRGARRAYPENTLEACVQAVLREGSMALLVDACLTADGEVVLWHDWDPNTFSAVVRQVGGDGVSMYRPAVPDADDPLRQETIALTLAQLRFKYGYELANAAADVAPAAFTVPTLGELVNVAREWPGLRHLLIDVRMPAEHAEQHAAGMLAAIVASLGGSVPFDVTLLVAGKEVLDMLKAAIASAGSETGIKLSWLSVPSALPTTTDGGPDYAAQDAAIREQSAVDGAIRHGTAIATLGRSPGGPTAYDYAKFVSYDIGRVEPYNLNPRENNGHQLERLLAAVSDNALEMQLLVATGVSGIITDDVPALLRVLAESGRF